MSQVAASPTNIVQHVYDKGNTVQVNQEKGEQAAAWPSSATGCSVAVAAARPSQAAASLTNIIPHDYPKENAVLSNTDEGIQDGTSPLPVKRNGDASNLRVGASKTERWETTNHK